MIGLRPRCAEAGRRSAWTAPIRMRISILSLSLQLHMISKNRMRFWNVIEHHTSFLRVQPHTLTNPRRRPRGAHVPAATTTPKEYRLSQRSFEMLRKQILLDRVRSANLACLSAVACKLAMCCGARHDLHSRRCLITSDSRSRMSTVTAGEYAFPTHGFHGFWNTPAIGIMAMHLGLFLGKSECATSPSRQKMQLE